MKPRACLVPACNTPASDLIEEPICPAHARSVYAQVKDALSSATNSTRVAAGSKNRARPGAADRPGIIYFAQFGDLVKIGYTTDLTTRMAKLRPDRLLALRPGSMRDERALHARFGPHWSHGEYFHRHPDIDAYVTSLAVA